MSESIILHEEVVSDDEVEEPPCKVLKVVIGSKRTRGRVFPSPDGNVVVLNTDFKRKDLTTMLRCNTEAYFGKWRLPVPGEVPRIRYSGLTREIQEGCRKGLRLGIVNGLGPLLRTREDHARGAISVRHGVPILLDIGLPLEDGCTLMFTLHSAEAPVKFVTPSLCSPGIAGFKREHKHRRHGHRGFLSLQDNVGHEVGMAKPKGRFGFHHWYVTLRKKERFFYVRFNCSSDTLEHSQTGVLFLVVQAIINRVSVLMCVPVHVV
jgi:hypothetical protein